MSGKLLEMKLSRFKELMVMCEPPETAKGLLDSVERALSGKGTDLDSQYVYFPDQFYKVVEDND